jgi:hypothetical protein
VCYHYYVLPIVLIDSDISKSDRKRAERTKFFDDFAKARNFNPLDAKKWTSVTYKEVLRAVCCFSGYCLLLIDDSGRKKSVTILRLVFVQSFNKILSQAETQTRRVVANQGYSLIFFQSICLLHLLFKTEDKMVLHRIFFDDFAKLKKFDPLDAVKWHSITRNEIVKAVCRICLSALVRINHWFQQNGKDILKSYQQSHIKALMCVYPELKLKKENFFHYKGRTSISFIDSFIYVLSDFRMETPLSETRLFC